MDKWVSGYIVEVAGKSVYETVSREAAHSKAEEYRKLGYGPVIIMQGPIVKQPNR